MAKIIGVYGLLLCVSLLGLSRADCPASCTCSETDISCNAIASLPSSDDLFSTNKQTVQTVSITGSPAITEIPVDYFVDLPALTTVTLTNNGLTALDVNCFKYLPMLETIDLTGNAIDCAQVNWVKEWLASQESNKLMGRCTSAENVEMAISDYTDFIDDVVPERLSFEGGGVTDISEDTGTAPARVQRLTDTSALVTKVITQLDDGTTAADVIIPQAELTFPQDYTYADIQIQVVDNNELNSDPRGFKLIVYAESILIGRTEGIFTISDNEVPEVPPSSEPGSNPTNEMSPKPATTKEPMKSGGGSAAWIIIVIIIVIIIIVVLAVVVYKRVQDRKRTTAKEPKAGYAPVKPEGEAKVYNPTTEELA